MDSFRKAYGALKDTTTVGLVKVNNGQFKELDIAIVKATNHDECPPKERHVRRIIAAVSISSPHAEAGYCIYALAKRLRKTHNWIVAVKVLIVFHRLLREGDPSFREQLVHISRKGNILPISNFKDDSGPLAWNSAWVQTYALFLEERVDCLRNLNSDIEGDKVPKSARGASNAISTTTTSNPQHELLEQLPLLQQLLYRLLCCQPEGIASRNLLIQYAFAIVVKESFRVYCAINDKIILLLDKFFEMLKVDAIGALDLYKRAGRQADQLADFYAFCRTMEHTRTFHFPILTQAPPSFLETMEEYIKEEPQAPNKPSEEEFKDDETEEEEGEEETEQLPLSLIDGQSSLAVKDDTPPLVDLIDLNEGNTESNQVDASDALAFAICNDNAHPTDNAPPEIKQDSWELVLFAEPSNIDKSQSIAGHKPVCPLEDFDIALLASLYKDDASRRRLQMQSEGYGAVLPQNPFDQQDPSANATMTTVSQQQQPMAMFQQQQVMMQQHQNYQQQNVMMTMPHCNNPYASVPQDEYSQQHLPVKVTTPRNPFADPSPYPKSH